jgi:glycine/D-amino acid oxidase-like deaminating enzyme
MAYDPLHSPGPGTGEAHPSSLWAATAGREPTDDGPLQGDLETDVAIIGAGYTGLTSAYFLARDHGIRPVVLEANRTGWGASGRNAGFVLRSVGRLGSAAMIRRWGEETALRVSREFHQGIETVRSLIDAGQIECERTGDGFLKIAHRPDLMVGLEKQARLLQEKFHYPVEVLDEATVKREHVASQEACGALRFPDGFGVNPLKLAHGIHRMARDAGATIHPSSPVTSWREEEGWHLLDTPGGTVRARRVISATNAHTPQNFHRLIHNRTLPVLTCLIVTRPLSEDEIQASGLWTREGVMDTRLLKYYYRRLPDNRVLIGGRGAIRGKDAELPIFRQRLLEALQRSFPALQGISYDHAWGGWITISLDDVPRVHAADKAGTVLYAMGYCGNGLAFSMQAGRRLAEKVAGITEGHDLPVLSTPLMRFPFPWFKRVGQFAYYQYGRVRDAWR